MSFLGKKVGLIVPLVSIIAYNVLMKAPYTSFSCSLLHIGCPSHIPIHGFVNDEYKEVYNIFVNNFKQGLDIGASISAYVDGKQVLSLQGGWHDRDKQIEYTNETLQMVYSCTKGLDAIIIAQLVEQGLLSYDQRISTYWPEFAQGNKENVTLEDLMRHKSGLACLDYPLSYYNASDLDRLADVLAKQPHNFGGKPVHAYHAITQGWVQNEIIRRVDPQHRTIDDFAREFMEKWGSEWYLKPYATEGLDKSRIAPFYPIPKYQQYARLIATILNPFKDSSFAFGLFNKNSLVYRSLINPHINQNTDIQKINPKHRSIEGPSYSGHTNADSMAKLAAMLANRGKAIVQGEPDLFTTDTTFEEATRDMGDYEKDAIFPNDVINNLRGGLMIFPNDYLNIPDSDKDAEFIGGIGASGAFFVFNEKYKIGFAYVTNGFYAQGIPDERSLTVIRAILKKVKELKGFS
ncbi:beta-lactamase/transpeptidase-like protein [Mucor mucedo]|uniref:beta-lactamase/transpeptidase-like protein n=1 Tax=Mucor mucedo TaxID=29922 RepID=UPI002220471F|nr:beta-lactamase/transpeptidase-like protein [Mucor mucedo]KAI7894202.1 beta-lactamase/transpeptidase-like protein [Mucor mucedo]